MPTLRRVRREKLLSQRDLATKAGVTPSTVYLIEAGRTRPHLVVMRKVCAALGVSPQEVDEFAAVLEANPIQTPTQPQDLDEKLRAG